MHLLLQATAIHCDISHALEVSYTMLSRVTTHLVVDYRVALSSHSLTFYDPCLRLTLLFIRVPEPLRQALRSFRPQIFFSCPFPYVDHECGY